MAEISELEQRLADALGRVRMAHQSTRRALTLALERTASLEEELANQPAPAPAEQGADPAELAALKAELEAATSHIATLQNDLEEERGQSSALVQQAQDDRAALQAAQAELTALKAADRLATVKANTVVEEMQERVGGLEAVLGQLQGANAQLRQNNALLREAQLQGGGDAALLNDSLTAEIESLKAAREADRAEIDSVLAALQPLIEETADA